MVIIAWLLLGALVTIGFLTLSAMSIGLFVALIVNIVLLPLRILIFVIRLILGIF